jgi:hypothetical protein
MVEYNLRMVTDTHVNVLLWDQLLNSLVLLVDMQKIHIDFVQHVHACLNYRIKLDRFVHNQHEH